MSSSSAAAAWVRKESKAKRTYYAEGLYDVVSLLAQLKSGCAVEMTSVPVHEAAAVVEVLSRAARSEGMAWKNPKLNNLRRLRDLASKLQVILDGLLVLLEEDPTDTGAGRELWKYGWALRNGADHLRGKGAKMFRTVGNLLIRHGDHVDDASKTAEWLRARLPDLRQQVTGLQAMSVSVPLDEYGAVDFDSDQGGSGSGSGSGNKGGGGSGDKGKGVSGGSDKKGKGVSGGSDKKGKGVSGGSDKKGKGVSGGSDKKGKAVSGGSDTDKKGKAVSGSGENGVSGKGGSGGAPVKKKGYYVKKKKGYYVKKRSGKGVSGEA